jgi:hypothetical protein
MAYFLRRFLKRYHMAQHDYNKDRFPEQEGSNKLTGDADSKHIGQRTGEYPHQNMGDQNEDRLTGNEAAVGKEKYLRETANIEDMPDEPVGESSIELTDESGEEKKEEYINTDERKEDIEQTRRDREKGRW